MDGELVRRADPTDRQGELVTLADHTDREGELVMFADHRNEEIELVSRAGQSAVVVPDCECFVICLFICLVA